jgi:hypothetical protein
VEVFLSLSLSLWFYSPWPPFQFLNLHTVGMTPWAGDQPVGRPLPTHRTTRTQNKRTQTYMLRVGFEPMTPVFQRAKTVHALDRAGTMIGGSGGIAPPFLTLALDGGQLHASVALPPGKQPPYPLYKRPGGPRAGSDFIEENKSLASTRNQTPTPRSSCP